jgi:C4-dicarboxylate-specific signal transduction histidine kinase
MVFELNERESALQSAQDALIQSEKMSAFGQLGAGIAHEVKNPLAGILGMAQLSLRKVDKESNLETNLKVIEKETRRCKKIIDNLMKFARQEKVDFSKICLNNVVEETTAIVAHQMSINNVKVELDLTDDDTDIEGNSNQIQQVIMNLMINAQQALNGDSDGKILIRTEHQAGNIRIEIVDNGPGIPEHVVSKVFEPFFTTKATGKGTGLGLSVSYGIIKDHNGELQVKSAEGNGSTFTITIPAFGKENK